MNVMNVSKGITCKFNFMMLQHNIFLTLFMFTFAKRRIHLDAISPNERKPADFEYKPLWRAVSESMLPEWCG